jgi:hypothetical protein
MSRADHSFFILKGIKKLYADAPFGPEGEAAAFYCLKKRVV